MKKKVFRERQNVEVPVMEAVAEPIVESAPEPVVEVAPEPVKKVEVKKRGRRRSVK